jgi:hypothetical protein
MGTMNPIIEFLKQAEGTVFVDEAGTQSTLRLLPPLTDQELSALETTLPCALPEDMRELFRFAGGFEGIACRLDRRFAIKEIDFADFQGLALRTFSHTQKSWLMMAAGIHGSLT